MLGSGVWRTTGVPTGDGARSGDPDDVFLASVIVSPRREHVGTSGAGVYARVVAASRLSVRLSTPWADLLA